MSKLVFIEDGMIFTNSIEIARGVNHSHDSVVKLLNKSKDLDTFSDLNAEKISTKGRPAEVYNLTEEQATLLIALMRNTPIVREFKNTLVKEFYKQRRALAKLLTRQDNAQYQAIREESKIMRLEETDEIKAFVNYASDRGSQSANKYYMAISKMELKALFFIEQKFPNIRDVMDFKQLTLIKTADMAVTEALKEGMAKELPYKEIYQLAKDRVEALAKIFPKSLLPRTEGLDLLS